MWPTEQATHLDIKLWFYHSSSGHSMKWNTHWCMDHSINAGFHCKLQLNLISTLGICIKGFFVLVLLMPMVFSRCLKKRHNRSCPSILKKGVNKIINLNIWWDVQINRNVKENWRWKCIRHYKIWSMWKHSLHFEN